jgi:hypothetical protein
MTRLDPWFRHAFAAETYRLLHAFTAEVRATSGVVPPATPILLASELLLLRHGNEAAWSRLEPLSFLDAASTTLRRGRPHEHKAVLVAFLAFLARSGVFDEDAVRRAELTPLPLGHASPDDPEETTLTMPSLA